MTRGLLGNYSVAIIKEELFVKGLYLSDGDKQTFGATRSEAFRPHVIPVLELVLYKHLHIAPF